MKNVNKEKLLEFYSSELAYGHQKIVADKAGVSRQSVSRFLKGKSNSTKIEKAIVEIIASSRKERYNLLKESGLI